MLPSTHAHNSINNNKKETATITAKKISFLLCERKLSTILKVRYQCVYAKKRPRLISLSWPILYNG